MAPRPGVFSEGVTVAQGLGYSAGAFNQRIHVAQEIPAELLDFIEHVVPEPRRSGKLDPVGLFVQANPEAEVVRVNVEFALHGDDVRRHQQEPAAAGTLQSGASAAKGSYWPRTLLERNASTAPSWVPVMAPLAAAAAGVIATPLRLSTIFFSAGWSITEKLWVFALDHEARSTTRTCESRRSSRHPGR